MSCQTCWGPSLVIVHAQDCITEAACAATTQLAHPKRARLRDTHCTAGFVPPDVPSDHETAPCALSNCLPACLQVIGATFDATTKALAGIASSGTVKNVVTSFGDKVRCGAARAAMPCHAMGSTAHPHTRTGGVPFVCAVGVCSLSASARARPCPCVPLVCARWDEGMAAGA